MKSRVLFGAIAFARGALSLVLSVPEPTSTDDARVQKAESTGWSPKPTSNPRAYDLGVELRKRSVAGSRTCGWVATSGDSSAVTCPTGVCALFTKGSVGMAGCCTSDVSMDWQNCDWAATCYDFMAIQSSKCGVACQMNSFVRICTDPESPYCVSWTYPGTGVQDYGCGSDAHSTWITVSPKVADPYITASANPPFAPQAAVTGYSNIPSGTAGGAAATSRSYTSSSDSSASSSTSSSSTFSDTSSGSSSTKKHVNIVVIVVIVVILVLVLAVAGGLIAFFCIRGRRQRRAFANNNNASGPAAMNTVLNQPPVAQVPPQQQPQQGYFASEPPKMAGQEMYGAQAAGMPAPYSKAEESAGVYQQPQQGYLQPQQGSPQMQAVSPAPSYTNSTSPYSTVGTPAPPYSQPQYPTGGPSPPINPAGGYGQPPFAAEAPDTSVIRGPHGGPVAELG